MSINTSISYNPSIYTIVQRALGLLGVQAAEDAVRADDYAVGLDFCNMLIKHLQGLGYGLWSQTESILFLTNNQSVYDLSASSADHAAANAWVVTTLTTAASSGASTVDVTLTVDPLDRNIPMAVGDNIGIVHNNVTTWDTIAGISGTTIALTGTVPSSGYSVGDTVFTYTSELNRPVSISNVRYRNGILGGGSPIDYKMRPMSRSDYDNQAIKNTPITIVTSYFYEVQELYCNLHLWLVPNDATGQVRFTSIRRLADVLNTGDNIDFPQEWILPLTYNLAVAVAPVYNKELKVNTNGPGSIVGQAKEMLINMKRFDRELVPTQFMIDD